MQGQLRHIQHMAQCIRISAHTVSGEFLGSDTSTVSRYSNVPSSMEHRGDGGGYLAAQSSAHDKGALQGYGDAAQD